MPQTITVKLQERCFGTRPGDISHTTTGLHSKLGFRTVDVAADVAAVTVYICGGKDCNLHCALVLKGGFHLSWDLWRSRCKAVMMQRLASGVKVCGLDEVRQARKVLGEYHQGLADSSGFGKSFVCQPVGEVSTRDTSRLASLADRINEDLGKEVRINPRTFGPGSTDCMVFPFMAAAALGIPASKLVYQAMRIVEVYGVPGLPADRLLAGLLRVGCSPARELLPRRLLSVLVLEEEGEEEDPYADI